MNAPMTLDQVHADPLLLVELKAMQHFLHLAPVGLLRADRQGEVLMMNPCAARLLAPVLQAAVPAELAPGAVEPPLNLFALLEPLCPGLRQQVSAFARSTGMICENRRLRWPASSGCPGGVLGLSLLKLSDDAECLMAVLTDVSSAAEAADDLRGQPSGQPTASPMTSPMTSPSDRVT